MPTRELDRGFTVHTFALPPAGFDARKASPRDLAGYGIPTRPDDAHLRERWERALARPFQMVQPRFRTRQRTHQKLPAGLAPPAAPLPSPMRTNYIGGASVTSTPAQGDVRWIEGTFTLPNTYWPVGGSSTDYPFSTWIGITGDPAGSSLLAGWDSYVYSTGHALQRSYYVWWRWYPGDTQYISNFIVEPGDTLSMVACLDLGSHVRARLTFQNLSTTQATTFAVTAPGGSELQANTASWMVSNDVVDFEGPFIARFGEMYVDECNAGTTDSPGILHPSQRIFLTDFDNPDQDVVVSNLLSDTLMQMRYVGS